MDNKTKSIMRTEWSEEFKCGQMELSFNFTSELREPYLVEITFDDSCLLTITAKTLSAAIKKTRSKIAAVMTDISGLDNILKTYIPPCSVKAEKGQPQKMQLKEYEIKEVKSKRRPRK